MHGRLPCIRYSDAMKKRHHLLFTFTKSLQMVYFKQVVGSAYILQKVKI